MNDQNPGMSKRMMIALVLSGLTLIAFDVIGRHFWGYGVMGPAPKSAVSDTAALANAAEASVAPGAGLGVSGTLPAEVNATRVDLGNSEMDAQVASTGGRMDNLTLKHFAEELNGPAGYSLFKSEGANAEYLGAGWMGSGIEGPGETTPWQVDSRSGTSVTLKWQNGSGQSFQRTISLRQDSYLLDVTDSASNAATLPVTLTPYVQLHRADGAPPHERSTWVNYSGPMGVVDGLTHESSYKDLAKADGEKVTGKGGWWGITGQYFMSAVVPGEALASERQFRHENVGGRDFFTASVSWPGVVVPAGGTTQIHYQIYAGPKQDGVLSAADNDLERAIDWGWFKAISKPLYHTLNWLHGHLGGSWALAVIALTLLLKVATFPLANKSYHSMAKMRKLQPKINAMKERLKDDQQAMALEMMNLYKQEKVNPVSGCWPMFIQIPIFFAMYKVVLVAFEFRHAPLGLWMRDMSAADPYYVLPVLMGLSMFVQFRLNPPPTDPTQAAMFKWMPVLMTVMFLNFPSGLVLYWLTNNVLSIGQQAFILKKDKAL